ncbi:BTAD domain-containing putative transcriptional regulator [Nocardiopsis sp. N85]|uniref:BTAD domain-containing putative transcriptional regulator n=1 Tax=Nocardiopsis sp. N85 TaxID=3029400 RepID=UPI00237F0A11|nr:BTAD domain-containing putative transcriptional regulator [Nocardiopsis sp. N85]MDE3722570.1 BTAD domain-containing putative transcriptional regulator [Nocardiopsis sp. N85]
MRVAMLGPFQIRDGEGRALPPGGRRMSALLARLALAPGRVVPAETLMADLWDDGPPEGGADTLRRLVSRTRVRLRGHGVEIGPVAHGGGYRLDVSPEAVDAHLFERLAAEGARLLREHAPDRAAETLDEALSLWRGDPFGGVDADFARREAPRLEEVRSTAVEDRIDALSRLGDPAALVPELRALCAGHPTRERRHGLLMRVLHETGQSGAALAVFEDLRRALAEELGADPSAWLRDLHGEILRHRPPAPPRGWTNPYLTRFFGRRGELAAIDALMERTRLVTLLGPGGVGKTRLATEYASGAATGTRVCFVELGPLRAEDSLTEAVTAGLGAEGSFPAQPGPDRTARLVSALSAAPTLLVLDNCEHLVDPAAELAVGLLARCPTLRVLATSREPLAVTGEALVRVEPMRVPEDGGGEAVAMFIELASLARPGGVNAEDTAAVTEICRSLDGLPLAIELAAARTRSMPIREVAHHLDERFRLLSGPRRAGTARHRTLRAVLDWTWNLLTEHERVLARRLAVLPGGATADTARAVCVGDGVPEGEVPFLLASLTDKSLLAPVDSSRGGPRHRLLETTRVYLEERLYEAGEGERIHAVAARHLADLSEAAFAMLLGRDQPRGLEILDTEHDNLLEALRHSCRGGDPGEAVRITVALSWYWIIRGRYEEAERWFGELDRRPEALTPTARTVAGAVRAILPRPQADAGARTRPLALDTAVLADHPPLAMIVPKHRLLVGDLAGMRADAATAAAHPHPWVRAAGAATSALVAEAEGDVIGAERRTADSAEAFRESGDLWTAAQLVAALAGFRSARGDVDGAVADLRRAWELEGASGASDRRTPVLIRLGGELVRAGRAREAEEVFLGALDAEPAPTAEHRIMCLAGLADLELSRGRPEAARELLDRARRLLAGPLADTGYLRVTVLCREAALALAEGDAEEAHGIALRARSAADLLGVAAVRAEATETVADGLWHTGRPEDAARVLGSATRIRGRRDDGSPRVRSLAAALISALGRERFERAYTEGAAGADPLLR